MLKRIANSYIGSFKGLSREIWWLAFVTLVNRAGTMVIPFLSKYLKEDLGYSFQEVGWIMVCFGLGSFFGAWLGGRFTDKIGFYKVIVFSLLSSGFLFIFLQYITSFWGLCIAIFVTMTVADMFRPALFVSLNTYSKVENRTRSLTLIRLAINLGFAIGPTLAGLAIINSGYSLLFWIDGLSCILAIAVFRMVVKERFATNKSKEKAPLLDFNAPVFKDKIYLLLLAVIFIIAFVFFQIFSTLPLYHKDQFDLSEFQSGLLFFLNGAVIFLFEMPMVDWFEKKGFSQINIIIVSTVFLLASYLVLLVELWAGTLIISMLLITFSEMLGFPYTNAFAMKRAKQGSEGRYMALYSMAFAGAHVLSPKFGLDIIAQYGYQVNFIILSLFAVVAFVMAFWLKALVRREKPQ